ncbi:UDP binding domain-containing protein [Mesobacillus boroniphilus]|uniref:UDP-glucose dehydrogenase n=1 Tax=Mesobacillus boroniphilus JCM 21738 TaxID=1294265 RepID=W4RKI5_9BACI|nr:UDP-glucose dehydrogenase [Mesobacillus boroniphilus JCM 21738]
MPEYVITRLMQVLNESGKALRGSKIAILGVAYKKDIDDVRESPVLKIIELLEQHGADYTVVDPYVASFRSCDRMVETVPMSKELLNEADLVLVTTDHSDFDYQMIAQESQVIFDTRNALKDVQRPNIYRKL